MSTTATVMPVYFLGHSKKSNSTKKPEQSSNNLHKRLFTHLPYGPD